MKIIRKSILAVGLLSATVVGAQRVSMINMLKVGLNAGVSTHGNTVANVGLDVSYQYLVNPSFGIGVSTGYNHFFTKEKDGIKNNDFGVVPLAAMFKFYPRKTGFYAGADLGYGFIVGKDRVASNYNVAMPEGGFYLRPELGYHNRDWNFFLHYTKVFAGDKADINKQEFNIGSIGAGVAYNIPLGK